MAILGIPDSTRKPGFYSDTNWSAGSPALPGNNERCLIIAPMAATGSTATPNKIVDVYSSEVSDLFGDSPATKMVQAALKAYGMLSLSVCPVAADATSIEPALTACFSGGHSMIATSFTDEANLLLLREYLDEVSSALEQRTALGFVAQTGAVIADVIALASKLNSGRMQLPYLRGTATSAAELAAAYMAVCASEQDPAMPLNTLELIGIAIPAEEQYLSRLEQETLLHAGVTPLECSIDKRVQIVRAITTYTKNAVGADDPAILDITKIRTADYLRRAVRNYLALRYPRVKYSSRVADSVKASIIAVLFAMEAAELIINVSENLAGLEITDAGLGRVNAKIPTTIIEGLHVFYAELLIVV